MASIPDPLHIAFFNRAYYPEVSATGQLLTELAEDLVHPHGCRVSVVAGLPLGARPPSPRFGPAPRRRRLVERERHAGVDIFRARGTQWSKRTLAGRIVNYLSYCGAAGLAGLQLERPDVVVALTDPPIIGLAAWLAARRARAAFVIAYKDLFPEVARLVDGRRRPVVEWVLHRVNHFLLRRADRVVALGDAMRRRLIEEKGADPAKVVIIPDWADMTAIAPGPKDNAFARTLGLADRFVVMHAGNLGLSQNLGVLVDAAAHLTDLPDLTILFLGDGVAKPALEADVARRGLQNVRFLPFQPKAQLAEVFAAADCFVVSLKPGLSGYIMPSKLYSILAAGRPYVAAVDDDCDVARITRTHECGLLASPGNPNEMAAQIRRVYENCPHAEAMGRRAREAAAAFDRPVSVRAYYDLCAAAAERPDGQGT